MSPKGRRTGARMIAEAAARCKALSGTWFKSKLSEHPCTLLSSSALNEEQRESIRSLYLANMSGLHSLMESSSLASHPDDGYFLHPEALYLIVNHDTHLIAFAMFKFEWDDLDFPENPVLYLYELQVVDSWRNQGIGALLMTRIEDLMIDHLQGGITKMVWNANYRDFQ